MPRVEDSEEEEFMGRDPPWEVSNESRRLGVSSPGILHRTSPFDWLWRTMGTNRRAVGSLDSASEECVH